MCVCLYLRARRSKEDCELERQTNFIVKKMFVEWEHMREGEKEIGR